MAVKGIREYDGKKVLFNYLSNEFSGFSKRAKMLALVNPTTTKKDLLKKHPWLKTAKLVAKPDQLFGKRGKHGLLSINKDFETTWKWIQSKMNTTQKIVKTSGKLTHFLIEPCTPHRDNEEMYVAIKSNRDSDTIYFSLHGGVFVEENWDKVLEIKIPVLEELSAEHLTKLPKVKGRDTEIRKFLKGLFNLYREGGFSYLEINPFTFEGNEPVALDLVAKVDDTSMFETNHIWKDLQFPASFGTSMEKEEEFIKELDEQTGSSLKLTVLNRKGRVWTMVAGGGASVIYADTVSDLGFAKELANYGEYSGNPSTEHTYLYAKTLLKMMTVEKNSKGKVLLIGGGIANFTDVAKTFTGIIQALEEFKTKIKAHKIKIFVRRGGPNYKEGLVKIEKAANKMGIDIKVFGPETHMTRIVSMALKGDK